MFPQIFGKYMLEREIAAGGMARVYLATLRGAGGFEKRLVVKQIRPELASDQGFVERFVKEAKTAVELSHPNIVPVYELGVEQGVYYIAMEHCDGATLSELLATTGPLDPQEGAYLGVEVCRALDYAHRRAQVIHRDVTPRNVLIDEEGAIKLIDFGIAAPAADGAAEAAHTEVFGSPGHMPPEQLAGQPLTPATDVFAVGVLLYEAFTGRPAFRRSTARECRSALGEAQPPLDAQNPELTPLAAIVGGAMQLDERERPPNAEALARPLREYLRGSDAGDVARRLGERVRTARRRGHSSGPWFLGEGLTGIGAPAPATPVTPALRTPGGTRTFATSRGFGELTRRVESDPPPPAKEQIGSYPPSGALAARDRTSSDRASTRRLPSSRPPPPIEAESASPRMLGVLRPRRWRAVGIGFALAAPVCAVLVAALWAQQGAVARAVLSPRKTVAAPVSDPARTSVASASVLPTLPSAAPRFVEPPLRRPASARPAREPAASVSSAEPASAALLSLTALPGTQVSVAGHDYPTPVSGLSLPAGRYLITFRNAAWDGPVSTQIVLLPGKASRVHADFTNEPPRVVVR
ncbi:MAG TPA: protein kinase [Polyangiaceae bacterium]|nr:protein kinase [Polyangiaceae bacterium]